MQEIDVVYKKKSLLLVIAMKKIQYPTYISRLYIHFIQQVSCIHATIPETVY